VVKSVTVLGKCYAISDGDRQHDPLNFCFPLFKPTFTYYTTTISSTDSYIFVSDCVGDSLPRHDFVGEKKRPT
jgi:hypothetical protein